MSTAQSPWSITAPTANLVARAELLPWGLVIRVNSTENGRVRQVYTGQFASDTPKATAIALAGYRVLGPNVHGGLRVEPMVKRA